MSITGTGIILMILGIYGLIFNVKFLYNITIFFIPFSATAIFNIGSGDNGSAIQPFMVLGSLWLVSLFIDKAKRFSKYKIVNKAELLALCLLTGFAIIALVSLIMPMKINGTEMGNISGQLDAIEPIGFSGRNITQYIYLLFGIIIAIGLYIHNKDENNYKNTIKVYALSIVFVVFWGVLELICYYKNITYPDFIFNNSISKSAGGFNGFLDDDAGTKRISSVAVEPSILVQSVEIFIPFLIMGIIKKRFIFNKISDTIFLLVLIAFIFRTTSTVGIVCLCFLIALSYLFYLRTLELKRRILFIMVSVFLIPVALLIMYGMFRNIIDQALFNKSDSYSGLERASAVIEAWKSFLNHPILGVGWGSVSSFDLFVKILSNTGLIGLALFVGFLWVAFSNQIKAKNVNYNKSIYRQAIIISFSTLIFSNIVSGFSFVFGFFWLATGLILVTGTKFSA
ncbi:O-Antigen ligase [Mucilaginibacter sp. OK268]|uniref:O-antigen ligase family protein n=1 Tax=Mucilaginibacter sp. OK268 TaxID=1881048 RepID=UPI00088E350E|nr:O-antigen ligase family protein [Mucilaginibacter sp. OK268]SDP56716.1 O-Antigen ligase [Mucilaginibacter sp. OK268]